jgi:hypothetical protein
MIFDVVQGFEVLEKSARTLRVWLPRASKSARAINATVTVGSLTAVTPSTPE